MRAFILAPRYNTNGKKDATGAFQPEAYGFAKHHGLPRSSVFLFDNKASLHSRRKQVARAIKAAGVFDTLAVFCHGSKDHIQAGFTLKTMPELVGLLREAQCSRVILYCCDTGRDLDSDRIDDVQDTVGGDGGFADTLRDAIAGNVTGTGQEIGGSVIFAHATLGHTSRLPLVRVFVTNDKIYPPLGTQQYKGGQWLIEPNKPEFPLWRQALSKTSLRWRFPFLTQNQILAELVSQSPDK